MKKYLSIIILFLTILLTSCTTEQTNKIKLPNLEGLTREEISEKLKEYNLEYIFYFDNSKYYDDKNLFIRYGNGLSAGSMVEDGSFIRIYTSPLELTYKISNTIEMDFDYVGKSFIEDGVGIVELVSATDGDTARFRDVVTGEVFRLRFLGIDTPESVHPSGIIEEYGKEASHYTCNVLKKADNIFLKADPKLNSKCEAYVKARIKFSGMEDEIIENYYKLNGYKSYNDFREKEPKTWDSANFQTYLAHYPGYIENYQEEERTYKEFMRSLNSAVDKALGDIGNELVTDKYGNTRTKAQEVFRLIDRLQEKRYIDLKYGETKFSPYQDGK